MFCCGNARITGRIKTLGMGYLLLVLHQFGFWRGKGVDDALQVTRRLVGRLLQAPRGGGGTVFHDIEKADPRVC